MENAGFTIILKQQYSSRHEIVLAVRYSEEPTYVTWEHDIINDSYYWGHYFSRYNNALTNYQKRIQNKLII